MARFLSTTFAVLVLCQAFALVAGSYQDMTRFIPTPVAGVNAMLEGMVCLCTANYTGPTDLSSCMTYEDFCSSDGPSEHTLSAGLNTGHWGIFYDGFRPALVVKSGDTIDIEMISAGQNAWDEQVIGDPVLEAMFEWTDEGPVLKTKGALGGGEGGHWLTGPIYVCGAEPGDVLQVDIVDLKPRPNPGKEGRSYGWTAGASWGFHYQPGVGYYSGDQKREIVTVWEVVMDEAGQALYAEPVYNYNFADANISTSCAPTESTFDCTYPETAAEWKNPAQTYGGNVVACINGEQQWERVVYGGYPIVVPEEIRDYSIRGKYRVPGYVHIGNIGLAPAVNTTVFSVAPMRTGGNMDQKRITSGATIYFPIEVPGALLSMGDVHGNQGDGETTGTGIEMSANAKIKVVLHKADSLPPLVSALDYPLIENANEYVVTGYTYNDYLREVDAEDPQSAIGSPTAKSDLNMAYTVTYNNTRSFLMTAFNLTEDEIIPLMGAVIDFGVTQVVDLNWGIHAIIPKFVFDFDEPVPYKPKIVCGTSVPLESSDEGTSSVAGRR